MGNPIQGLYGWKDGVAYSSFNDLYYNGIRIFSNWGGPFTACEFMSYPAGSMGSRSQRTLILANGSRVIITSGSEVWEVGIDTPDISFMRASIYPGIGFTVRRWYYKLTFIARNTSESNVSSETVSINPGYGGGVLLDSIPIAPVGCRKRLYRTTGAGTVEGPYFLCADMAGDATSFVDTCPDESLAPITPPYDHDPPINRCTIVQRSDTRWFLSGDRLFPSRVYYSKPAPFAESWPLDYYVDMPDTVKAMYPIGNQMAVLTDTTPLILSVDSLGFTKWSELPTRIPCLSTLAVTTWENTLFWRGPFGLYKSNAITIQEDSESVRDLIPLTLDASSLTADTMSRLLLTLNPYSTGLRNGMIVRIVDIEDDEEDDVYIFQDSATPPEPCELGTIRQIVHSEDVDTYLFSQEVGRVTYIEGTLERIEDEELEDVTSYTAIREARGNQIIWSKSIQPATLMSLDLEWKRLYVAYGDTVYIGFEGDRLPWNWKSVQSYLGYPGKRKRLTQITMYLKGLMEVSIYGDRNNLHTYRWPQDFYDFDGTQGIFTGTPSSEWNDTMWADWVEWSGIGTEATMVKFQALWDTWAYVYQIEIVAEAGAEVHLPIQYFFEIEHNI